MHGGCTEGAKQSTEGVQKVHGWYMGVQKVIEGHRRCVEGCGVQRDTEDAGHRSCTDVYGRCI